MKHSKLKVDANGRLKGPCPICENDDIRGDYCNICGNYIVNVCTGCFIDDSGEKYFNPKCFEPLKGGDRYCSQCGAESSFLQNKFLKPFDDAEMTF